MADDDSITGMKRTKEEHLAMDTLAQAPGSGEHVGHCSTDKMATNMTERQGNQVDEDTERPKQIAVTADDDSSMRTKRSKEEQLMPVDTNHQAECNVSLQYSKPPSSQSCSDMSPIFLCTNEMFE
jgi:hypothetical protein